MRLALGNQPPYPLDDSARPAGLRGNLLKRLDNLAGFIRTAFHYSRARICIVQYGAKRLIKLVSKSRSHLPHRIHTPNMSKLILMLPRLFFSLFSLRDVSEYLQF